MPVTVANPGRITNVSVANPGSISSVGNASSGNISGVVNNYGQQQQPFSGVPINLTPAQNAQVTANQQRLDDTTSRFDAILKALTAATAPKPAVYAPKLDFAAVNAQARAAAENAVNPYYTKALNDFLTQQAAQKQRVEAQTATNIKNIEDSLKQTQDANALTGARTAQDVASNQEQINIANDQNQVDTGTAFEDARIAQAKDLAQAGVLGSGAGNRATAAATANRNTAEGRQNAQFQEQRQQQELFKTRTFEDLAKSNELAGISATKGKEAAKFDLDTYIQNAQFDEQNQRNTLEAQRLASVQAEQQNQSRLLVNNFINSIADPAQRQAAVNAYSGAF